MSFVKAKNVRIKVFRLKSTKLEGLEYNYDTILNVQPYATEVCTTFREAMKHWNVCIQYWLAVNVYKRFPSKKYRTLVTLIVSAVWHGVYTGYYVCIGGAPFYLAIEDVWVKIVLKGNEGRVNFYKTFMRHSNFNF